MVAFHQQFLEKLALWRYCD